MAPPVNCSISVIIPAYNEKDHIVDTVQSVQQAFSDASVPLLEVIVSDDASDDGTGELAQEAGAKVVLSGKRNIGATRNVGAAAAQGEWVLFVDADTVIEYDTVKQTVEAIESGSVGGGARIAWNGHTHFWADCVLSCWNTISRIFKLPAGSYLFAKKEIFDAVGGFNEELYASEELDLGFKLKKHGKLRIVKHPVKTSPRKVHQFSTWEFTTFFLKMMVMQRRVLKSRKHLDIWYKRRH